MYEITTRLDEPYSSICYIQCDWSDGTATRASGVVVGYNDVLTALHVVYQADHGGWATRITIIPAADTSPWIRPFGQFTNVGAVVGRAPNWDLNGDGLLSQAESAGDLALLGMTTRLGDQTGWLPVSQMPQDFNGLMVGYPARGTGMMAEASSADASEVYSVYNMSGSLGAGASGGPLLMMSGATSSVVGVLSSGNSSDTTSTYAGLFMADTWSWLQGAMAANDSLLAGNAPTSVSTANGTVYTGTANADNMTGGAGRDQFSGLGGNDGIDGAAGLDTAVYIGTRGSYNVTVLAASIVVADSVQGRDATDTLRNIERVQFADLSLAFDVNGNAGMAYRLYQAAFNRAPDVPGLGFQMKALDDGLAYWQLAANFLQSPEFSSTYGNLSNQAFVTQLYANVLHRAPDDAGLAYHINNLESGAAGRHDVLAQFSESPENQAALIGAMQNGMTYTV